MLRRIGTLLAALMLVSVALPAFAAGSNNGLVRVIHASPDAPAVDVFVDGTAVLTGVTFPAISNYLSVPAGEHTFKVAPAGAGEGAAVITATANVQAGAAYTVAAIGQLANIKGQIYSDNLAAPAAGKAHVRVLHLSPDAPAVDVKTQDNAVTLFSNVAYPNASAYVPVDAGTYDLKVTAAGSTDAVVSLDDVALNSGVIYDAVAVGLLGDSSLRVVLASYTPAALPDTGVADMPVALLASAAVAVLASGMVLRRRLA
jgi:hypothetical protein